MHARFNLTDIEQHPLREYLNNEFHARTPVPLNNPSLISHLAFQHDGLSGQDERENVLRICRTQPPLTASFRIGYRPFRVS